MAASDYYICPVCDGKALYDADEYGVGQADVEVLHRECLAKDRVERERAVREQIAEVFRTDGELLYMTDHAMYVALNGIPRPSVCTCHHHEERHRDLTAGWTSRDMTTVGNGGRCQDCDCRRYVQDRSPAVEAVDRG